MVPLPRPPRRRSKAPPSVVPPRLRIRVWLPWVSEPGCIETRRRPTQPTSSFGSGPSDEHRRGKLARLRRWFFSLCWLPDGHLGWLVPAVAAGLRMCRKHRIDVIVSSGPPHTAHLVALLLKRFTQLPWIADFRDPWTQNPGKPAFVRSAFSDWVERGLERRVLASADRLVTVTHRAAAALALRQASLATKTTTIMTGFDPNEFDSIGPVSSAETFTLAHVGSVYLHRSPTALLQAVALLTRSRGIPLGAIRLVFVGEDLSGLADTLRIADQLGISSLVTAPGPVRRTDALAWMRRANLLVLLAQGQPLQVPTKAFEYLASGTPILAIVDDGATADLMHATNNRTVPDDPVKIAEAIAAHLDRRSTPLSASSAPWRRSAVREFTREHSSEALVALMESSLHAGSYR